MSSTSEQDSSTLKRLYQVWKGNNLFLCNGYILFGPEYKTFILTLILIIIPSILFITVCVDLINDLGSWCIIIDILLFLLTLIFFLTASLSDPGIIPRNPPLQDGTYRKKPLRSQDIIISGNLSALKYCETCNIYRPPRCSHCSICDNCVVNYDHHCPWLGTYILFLSPFCIFLGVLVKEIIEFLFNSYYLCLHTQHMFLFYQCIILLIDPKV